jgi:hypothetical protein
MTIQLKKLFEMADRAAELERNKETVYVVVDEYTVIGVFTDRDRAHKIAYNREAVVEESYIDRGVLK